MKTETLDPVELFAELDPLSTVALRELADAPSRETTLARIVALRGRRMPRDSRLPKWRIALVVVAVFALAIPALAFSGALESLFGFSNRGTAVSGNDQWIVEEVRALTGEPPSSVVHLASHDGWTFYGARTSNDACYFDEPPSGSTSDGIPNFRGGDCKDAAGDPDFPSPARPIFNMSHYDGPTQTGDMSVITLAGVAADGVASVQLLALSDCRVVATAPVVDNVYAAPDLPLVPEAQVVARDAAGKVVWHQAVGAAVQPAPSSNSCGLG